MIIYGDTIDFDCKESTVDCIICQKENECSFKIITSTNDTIVHCNADDNSLQTLITDKNNQCVLTLECESTLCLNSEVTCDNNYINSSNTTLYNVECTCFGDECHSSTDTRNDDGNDEDDNIPIPVDESLLIVFFIAFFGVLLCCFCVLCIALCMCGLYFGEKKKQNKMNKQLQSMMKFKQKVKNRRLSFLSNEKSTTDHTHRISSYLSNAIMTDEEKENQGLIHDDITNDNYRSSPSSVYRHNINHLKTPQRSQTPQHSPIIRRQRPHLFQGSNSGNKSPNNCDHLEIEMKKQESDGMESQREGIYVPKREISKLKISRVNSRKHEKFNSEDLYNAIPTFTELQNQQSRDTHTTSNRKGSNDSYRDDVKHCENDLDLVSDDESQQDGNPTKIMISVSKPISKPINSNNNDNNNDHHSDSGSTLTVETHYTMDGHVRSSSQKNLIQTNFDDKYNGNENNNVEMHDIFMCNDDDDNQNDEKDNKCDDITEDISATLPLSPDTSLLESEKITKHPPKDSLLRPPTNNGMNLQLTENIARKSSMGSQMTSVFDEGQQQFVISPMALSQRSMTFRKDSRNLDDDQKASYPMDKNNRNRKLSALPDQNSEDDDNDNDDDDDDDDDDKHEEAKVAINNNHQATTSITTFATYHEDGDYKDTINPLHNLNPLRKVTNHIYTQSVSEDTDLQSESTFTIEATSELSRTTSAAAVHVAFPTSIPNDTTKIRDGRYKIPFTAYNRYGTKQRNYYSEQFYNFKPNMYRFDANNNNNDDNNNNNNNKISVQINTKLNNTPPPSSKETSISTTVFDVEEPSLVSKIPSSTLVPSLPNSPFVKSVDLQQLRQNHNVFTYDPPPPPPALSESLPQQAPDLELQQKSDDTIIRKRSKSRKKRSKSRSRRDRSSSNKKKSPRGESNGTDNSKTSKRSKSSRFSTRSKKNKDDGDASRNRSNSQKRNNDSIQQRRNVFNYRKCSNGSKHDESYSMIHRRKTRKSHHKLPSYSNSQTSPIGIDAGITLINPHIVDNNNNNNNNNDTLTSLNECDDTHDDDITDTDISSNDDDDDDDDHDIDDIDQEEDMLIYAQSDNPRRSRKSTGNIDHISPRQKLAKTERAKRNSKPILGGKYRKKGTKEIDNIILPTSGTSLKHKRKIPKLEWNRSSNNNNNMVVTPPPPPAIGNDGNDNNTKKIKGKRMYKYRSGTTITIPSTFPNANIVQNIVK